MTAPAKLYARAVTDEQAPARGVAAEQAPARVAATFRSPLALAPTPAPPAEVPHPAPRPRRPATALRPALPPGREAAARAAAFTGNRLSHVVLAVVVTLVVVGALAWLGRMAEAGVPAETTVVRVGAGETVWDVAERVAPESDPRAVVQRIRELNAMTGSAVQPGQRLQVPDGQ